MDCPGISGKDVHRLQNFIKFMTSQIHELQPEQEQQQRQQQQQQQQQQKRPIQK